MTAARRTYGRAASSLSLPGLVEHQVESYRWLIERGLSEAMSSFIFTDGGERLEITLHNPRLDEPEMSVEQCLDLRFSYEGVLRCVVRVHKLGSGEILQRDGVKLCLMPVMTDDGGFVITGSRRVVVSQFVRAPGVYFSRVHDPRTGDDLVQARFLPQRGTRLIVEMSPKRVMTVQVGRSRRCNAAVLLRAVGMDRDGILRMFAGMDPGGEWLEPTLEAAGRALDDADGCLRQVHGVLDPGAPVSAERGAARLRETLMSAESCSLGTLGRRRLNESLHGGDGPDSDALCEQDIVSMVREAAMVQVGRRGVDDVDHLGNRRVRRAGELISEAFRSGLAASRRATVQRLVGVDSAALLSMSIARLVNFDQVGRSVRNFFRSSPLCQFLDNANPLSEVTHKRRITALGPGGIDRRRAGIEVRDVHQSYYGRICPIESPEGQNIGLVSALAAGASFDEDGFIVAPYLRVLRTVRSDHPDLLAGRTVASDVVSEDGITLVGAGQSVPPPTADRIAAMKPPFDIKVAAYVSDEVARLDAFAEQSYHIGQASLGNGTLREIPAGDVEARFGGEVMVCSVDDLDFVDVSVRQMFSVSTLMIPFLNHNDANRALMGANMQRQALPLERPEASVVSTGMERVLARSPGHSVLSRADGTVVEATAERVSVLGNGGELVVHPVRARARSNQNTFMSQRTRVRTGQVVGRGEVLADGYASRDGRAALGQNVLAAFLSWEGFNYEDSIVVSERLMQSGKFLSNHIRDLHVIVRPESSDEITPDVPGLSEKERSHLGQDGLVRVGTRVHPGDVLVGKRSVREEPVGEEALMIGLWGDPLLARWRDSSLRAGKSDSGVVVSSRMVSGEPGDPLPAGAAAMARVSVARARPLSVGDKMSGRHGNKGLVSVVLPVEDMPILADGRPVDVVLNPLGVPSRMNLGQLMEVHLGMAAEGVGFYAESAAFDGASWTQVQDALAEAHAIERFGLGTVALAGWMDWARWLSGAEPGAEPEGWLARAALSEWLRARDEGVRPDADIEELRTVARRHELDMSDPSPVTGKFNLRDGRSGDILPGCQTVGVKHMLKLSHLADDKMHSRSVGTYQEITQQPLGGKSMGGGQRLGEMEVWALESYGAAFNLLEMMTVKSDDIEGRAGTYASILSGDGSLVPSRPESFRVLAAELAGLGISLEVLQDAGFGSPSWTPVVDGS